MGNCGDCKWWGVNFGGVCDLVATIHADDPLNGFHVEATLYTAPRFGCVNFCSKPSSVDV